MTPSFVSLESADESPADSTTREVLQFVRQDPASLSDEALEAYIHGCAREFLAAQRRWEETGCFAAVGERDSWWHEEAAALRERGNRPGVVARLEKERGLA